MDAGDSGIEGQDGPERSETETEQNTNRPPSIGGKKCSNGEKCRHMQRIRRLIDELNGSCEEHLVLAVVRPDSSNHVSYYGSRSLMKCLYKSNLVDIVKDEKDMDDKTASYIPATIATKNRDDSALTESELYAQVQRLLDLYNYPAKEHFSYKCRGKPDRGARPKPEFWPKDVKFTSLVGGNILSLIEPDASRIFLTRREIILRVLIYMRQFHRVFVDRLLGTERGEDELVDIENVANHEEVDPSGESTSYAGESSLVKEEFDTTDVKHDIKRRGSGGRDDFALTESNSPGKRKQMPPRELPHYNASIKRRKCIYTSGSSDRFKWNSPYLATSIGDKTGHLDFVPVKDRVLTLNPVSRFMPLRPFYEIREPPETGSNLQPAVHNDLSPMEGPSSLTDDTNNDGQLIGGSTVVIDGQEYTVVDGDEEIDDAELYEEIPMHDVTRFPSTSSSHHHDGSSLLLTPCTDRTTAHDHLADGIHDNSHKSNHLSNESLPDDFVLSHEDSADFDPTDHHHHHLAERPRACRLVRNVVLDLPEGPVIQKYVVKRRPN